MLSYSSCEECGRFSDLTRLGQKELCNTCFNQHMNGVIHTCRGCGKPFTRLSGMHSTPLEPDGSLVLQARQVRDGPDKPWYYEDDVISRVICADCCPATEHNDGAWCSILTPWGSP
jgi:hypothetical protein